MTASSAVAWIAAALVCNLLAMRLIFEFMQLWYLGLALPAALFGPSFALVYGGSWMGGKFADRLRKPAIIMTAGLLVVAASRACCSRSQPSRSVRRSSRLPGSSPCRLSQRLPA
jgi:hypothetical protein